MEQYIKKSALVAEIKTRIETYNKGYANGDDCRADALETFLHDIDFLEVEEGDLEKEFFDWYHKESTNDYNASILYERYSTISKNSPNISLNLVLKHRKENKYDMDITINRTTTILLVRFINRL